LREEEKKAEEIPEKKWQPTQKKLPSLVIEKDEDHVPLKEQRGNHQTKRKRRKKSSILAKLVYVHEGREAQDSGRAKLKNPHDFARRFEDTEVSSRSSSTWRRTPTFNRWKPSASAVMGLLLKKGLKIIPQDISSSLAATLGNASSGEKLWRALEEGSWENVEAFFSQVLPSKEGSQERRKLKDLCTYLSGNSQGNPECQKLPGCSQCQSPWKPLLQAYSPIVPWAIFKVLKFNGCSVRHDFLRTQRAKLPPFTLSPETTRT
jgi:hypothetical protein